MSDRRRLVRIDNAGTVTVVRDYEDGVNFQSIRASTKITPGPRKPTLAKSQRRYGGSRQTGESHDNGTFAWSTLVQGTTADNAMANAEALFGDIESPTLDLFIEWRPDGTSNSVYYELRGPATWNPAYDWAQFSGAKSMQVDVSFPVAPLVRHTAYNIAIPSTTLPAIVSLASPVTGTAPSLADIAITVPSGAAAAPIFALMAWTTHPTASLVAGSDTSGFSIFNGFASSNVSGWASAVDATYRGGNGLKITTSGAGNATMQMIIDPSVLTPDAFSRSEITLEFWARVQIASTVVSPKFVLSCSPVVNGLGGNQYSAEFGSAGKAIVLPSSGTAFRFVRLGTLNLPIDTLTPQRWSVKIAASWGSGSSGALGLDYIASNPVRQRALSPTAKANDATYPPFLLGTASTATKTIRADLSGTISVGANPARTNGLGGSPIEMPPGNVDLLVKLSSLVPDDPTLDATSETLSYASITGSVRVTPRSWLAGTP